MRTCRLIVWLTAAGFLWAGNAFAQDDFLKDLDFHLSCLLLIEQGQLLNPINQDFFVL